MSPLCAICLYLVVLGNGSCGDFSESESSIWADCRFLSVFFFKLWLNKMNKLSWLVSQLKCENKIYLFSKCEDHHTPSSFNSSREVQSRPSWNPPSVQRAFGVLVSAALRRAREHCLLPLAFAAVSVQLCCWIRKKTGVYIESISFQSQLESISVCWVRSLQMRKTKAKSYWAGMGFVVSTSGQIVTAD